MVLAWSGYLFAAIYGIGFLISLMSNRRHWLVARMTTFIALLVDIIVPIVAYSVDMPQAALTTVMGLLVAVLGWVIVDYASRYLDGDSGQPRFVRAMLFTLFAVALLVKSDNLLLMALAWSSTSVSLHFLLTHYQERKAAQIVAHKKFIVSRLADVCLIIALSLVYYALGTFSLASINTQLSGLSSLPLSLTVATFLFVLAAMLRTAQLPLHGWLIQVMEAPTPVSALLHAGVVNMGGFVLISLAAMLNLAPLLQALLVVVGGMTAVLAGWVMMTRISIKVRLAWSTCAQMGFMLMEIGLGLYELALLHLIAHSFYKAYNFLAAGEAVEQSVSRDYLPQTGSLKGTFVAVLLSAAMVIGVLWCWQYWWPALTLPTAVLAILIVGFSTLFWHSSTMSVAATLLGALRVLLLLHLYLLWHVLFASIAPAAAPTHPALLIFVCIAFALLYAGQVAICRYANSNTIKRLYPWVYNGFYLDETFTRLTFKLWPVKLSSELAQTQVNRHQSTDGELA
ncbi:NADH-quinone oxidoreductase subunit L [Idiomarina xiamenensis]|uniref:Probable inorganic carbon transporter subunit DabB n=1 Tax=Idiomarina xiamenensis 10-D-4 TaxID=740709 RepID=K2KF33_9GAMM|nr:NADH-quinone oxidoreductase subunit L [Idiomarina xiamenensis]EKE85347.1 putative NADH dehydrogenase [Idiomarina xiamenensis 10-D-4]